MAKKKDESQTSDKTEVEVKVKLDEKTEVKKDNGMASHKKFDKFKNK